MSLATVIAITIVTATQVDAVSVTMSPYGVVAQTRIFRGDLGGLGLGTVRTVTVTDTGTLDGPGGVFSGFDLDFVLLDADGSLATVGDQVLPFQTSATFVTPGWIRTPTTYVPTASHPGVLFGLNVDGSIDFATATITTRDAIYESYGLTVDGSDRWVTLGDNGSLTAAFPNTPIGSHLWLFVGEVGVIPQGPTELHATVDVTDSPSVNQPPVAVCQSMVQRVAVGDVAYLDGSESYDPDDDPLTYQWSFASVPVGSAAVIVDPTAVQTTFVPDLPGEYVVSLVVNDGAIDSEPATVTITAIAQLPDLAVTSEDISCDPLPGVPGTPSLIAATIWNAGEGAADNVTVRFTDGDTEIGLVMIPTIAAWESKTISIEHVWTEESFRFITVTIDPSNNITEEDEANNSCSKLYQVGDISQMQASLDISCSSPVIVYECGTVPIEGEAVYSISVAGQLSFVYPAKGNSVSAYLVHSQGTEFLPQVYTDSDGAFALSFAPPVAAGEDFELIIEVTDGTLTGTWSKSFHVDECKDLWVHPSDIEFSNENPGLADTIDITATIHADPGNTTTVTDIPVTLYGYHSSLGKFQIGLNQTIAELPPGGSESLSVAWTNQAEGEYYIEVLIGPAFSDNNNSNNKAGRALWVGPQPPPPPPAMFTIVASPYYAITGDIVQITVDSSEALPSDSLDSITITDSAGASVPLLSGTPEHPSRTCWIYRTQAISQSMARGQAAITVTGTDDESNSHTGTGHFQSMDTPGVIRDLWVHSDDIVFSKDPPELGETVAVETVVHADPENTHAAFNVPVSFFAHHGSGSSYQIGRTTWINELPSGTLEWSVSTTWRNAAEGDYIIEVELGPGFSDDDNSNNQATRATIVGNRPPVAVCQDIQVSADENCQAEVSAQDIDAGSHDPDGEPITFSLLPLGPYPLGQTPVTLTATDPRGESAQCHATITVVDDTPPYVLCPGDITVVAHDPDGVSASDPAIAAFLQGASASDNCEPSPLISHDAADHFPLGTTSVTFTATDASSNTSTCQATVIVIVEDFYLHGVAPDLTLDSATPTGTAAKYKDSPSLRRAEFKEIGAWTYAVSSGMFLRFNSVGNLRVWVGLKNSDDQGTYFDLRAELLRNGVTVASCETLNIQGVTRNPDKAKEVVLDFGVLPGVEFYPGDDLSVRVLAKVTDVGGHSSAVGLRLYYDSVSRPSRFKASSSQ